MGVNTFDETVSDPHLYLMLPPAEFSTLSHLDDPALLQALQDHPASAPSPRWLRWLGFARDDRDVLATRAALLVEVAERILSSDNSSLRSALINVFEGLMTSAVHHPDRKLAEQVIESLLRTEHWILEAVTHRVDAGLPRDLESQDPEALRRRLLLLAGLVDLIHTLPARDKLNAQTIETILSLCERLERHGPDASLGTDLFSDALRGQVDWLLAHKDLNGAIAAVARLNHRYVAAPDHLRAGQRYGTALMALIGYARSVENLQVLLESHQRLTDLMAADPAIAAHFQADPETMAELETAVQSIKQAVVQ